MPQKTIQEKPDEKLTHACQQGRALVKGDNSNCDYEDCVHLVFDDANVGLFSSVPQKVRLHLPFWQYPHSMSPFHPEYRN